MTRRWAMVTAGLAAGFSGLAVIGTILSGVPLAVFEVILVFVPIGAAIVIIRNAPAAVSQSVWRIVRTGIVVGFGATVLYDFTRTILSYLDPSPYNPFEVLRFFGRGLVGVDASDTVILAAGFLVHYGNGTSFGVIYAVFGGQHARSLRGAVVSGIIWGLTLEFIQSILYPGWLQITTVLKEFLLFSGIGHFVYGVSLGLGVRWLLTRATEREGRRD